MCVSINELALKYECGKAKEDETSFRTNKGILEEEEANPRVCLSQWIDIDIWVWKSEGGWDKLSHE